MIRLTLLTLVIVVVTLLLLSSFMKSLMREQLLRFTGEQQRRHWRFWSARSAIAGTAWTNPDHGGRAHHRPRYGKSHGRAGLFAGAPLFMVKVFNGGAALWNRTGQRLTDAQFEGMSAVNQPLDPARTGAPAQRWAALGRPYYC